MENIPELPDIQHTTKPEFKIPIRQVGVENVKTDIILEVKNGGYRKILSTISMSTNLDSDKKGISMSMLMRTLINYLELPLKHRLLINILREFKNAVETDSDDSYIRFDFELPMIKESPISKLKFPQFYKCSFEGRLIKDSFRFLQRVRVPYASYCPCSASLCKHLENSNKHGYPHAQRSYANVLVLPNILDDTLWLEDIIYLVECAIKTSPVPILRRIDEQEFAKVAYENTMFVEDAVRYISNNLDNDKRILDWIVKCTHYESIHTHEAIAINWKGIEKGFNELNII